MTEQPITEHRITLDVNGRRRSATVEARRTLVDVLREDLRLTGTHVGCEHGVCGACTVLVDGRAVRSCLMFAVQADGSEVTTVEGLSPAPGELGDVQRAFRDCHGLQCGFCTPGFIVSVEAFLAEHPAPTDAEIRSALTGNLCRCTGYQGIVKAVRQVVRQRAAPPGDAGSGPAAAAEMPVPVAEMPAPVAEMPVPVAEMPAPGAEDAPVAGGGR